MASDDFTKAAGFSKFAKRTHWIQVFSFYVFIVLTGVVIAGMILLFLVFPSSGMAKIVFGVFLGVLLALYFLKVGRRLISPTFACPNCNGKVLFHWQRISGWEQRELVTCAGCGLSAPTGAVHDPTDTGY